MVSDPVQGGETAVSGPKSVATKLILVERLVMVGVAQQARDFTLCLSY